MNYARHATDTAVTLSPSRPANASVIWLHGLGADGNDFVPIVPELDLRDSLSVRFIFPHAPQRPITVNNGYVMRAWYDIKVRALQGAQDEAGMRASQQTIHGLIQEEVARGIACNKIVIAGFSQGGAIALQTGLRYPQRLCGVMALSTYLPLEDSFAAELSEANRDLPIFMCHGRQDQVLPFALGEHSRDVLQAHGLRVEFHTYDMPHSVCPQEVVDIAAWLNGVLA